MTGQVTHAIVDEVAPPAFDAALARARTEAATATAAAGGNLADNAAVLDLVDEYAAGYLARIRQDSAEARLRRLFSGGPR